MNTFLCERYKGRVSDRKIWVKLVNENICELGLKD